MSDDARTAVLAAEKRRRAAMLAGDLGALEELLDPRLQFVHSTGAVDDRATYLAKMAVGRIEYIDIVWSEERVIELAPGAALLAGRMVTGVRVDGTGKRLDNRVVTAWTQRDGAWRLVAFQSTPLAG